jgi:hypothetical protein
LWRTSKSQLSKKLQKAFTFRLEYQREISLDLNHSCRYRKRLISLINFATLYIVKRQVCCKYSEHICVVFLSYLLCHVQKQSVTFFEKCVHVFKEMSLYPHSKNIDLKKEKKIYCTEILCVCKKSTSLILSSQVRFFDEFI